MLIQNFKKKSKFALVIDWDFHKKNKWVSIFPPYFVDAFIKEFDPIIICSQLEYILFKNKIDYIVSMEPGWAAPKIKYDGEQVVGVFISDPHNKTKWLEDYIENNFIRYVFSQYYAPFFYHFPNFPREKFIYLPWAIPDKLISKKNIKLSNSDILIFGGKTSEAYDVRNWCRKQKYIIGYDNSGVENKILSNRKYLEWINGFDAIVAAGSSKPIYDLVTPKYFEIASAGSLLIGQKCDDLERLGFNENNALIFIKSTFNGQIERYKKNPELYIEQRKEGRELIIRRHKISDRIKKIRELFNKQVNI